MNKYIYLFLLTFFSFIGYKIKPTVIISLIAIIMVEIWNYLFSEKNANFKMTINKIFSIILAISLVGVICNLSKSYLGYERNVDVETPMTHFIMMGMNDKMKGCLLYTSRCV